MERGSRFYGLKAPPQVQQSECQCKAWLIVYDLYRIFSHVEKITNCFKEKRSIELMEEHKANVQIIS